MDARGGDRRGGLRWAIIGAGAISDSFVPDLKAVGEVNAAWAPREEAVAAFSLRHGIPHHSTDLAGMLARADIDVVYIATPPATHLPIALDALAAGKHVLVEKPMTTSAADTRAIFDSARERGLFAMEAMWMKFNPLHREVMQKLDRGVIGEPRFVRAGFGMPFPPGGTGRARVTRASCASVR